jgi:hypothetical protein
VRVLVDQAAQDGFSADLLSVDVGHGGAGRQSRVLPLFPGAGAVMTPDQACQRARRLEQDLLVAEAEQAALGWMYLTAEGIDIEPEPGLERYLRAPDAFDKAAAGRGCR